MTIYALGLDTDKTLVRFVERAGGLGHEVLLLDLARLVRSPWRIELSGGDQSMRFEDPDGTETVLDPTASYYVRSVDLSPALDLDEGPAWRMLLAALTYFLDDVPAPVVNRPGSHCHNGAKPLHEWWLAQRGFLVPASMTTSTAEVATAFADEYERVIVKALAGTRGTAQCFDRTGFERLDPRQGPVHLQEWIDGFDVRVHMVAGLPFAERIDSDAVDYRAADAEATHEPTVPPDDLVASMADASSAMGLLFTGWDFRVDREGRWWCLEANPMPGYDVYDRRCDGAITRAVCDVLTHGSAR